MQDQGRRLLLAVVVAFGVLFVWTKIFPPKKDAPPPPPTTATATPAVAATPGLGVAETPAPTGSATGSAASPTAAGSASVPATATASEPKPAALVEAPRGPEQKITLDFPNVVATFSSYGGDLLSWRLTDPRYQKDATKGELLANKPDHGAFHIDFAGSTYWDRAKYVIGPHAEWKGEKLPNNQVRYTYHSDHLEVVKTFTVFPETYLVQMTVSASIKVAAGEETRETLAVSASELQDVKDSTGGSSRVAARAWVSSTLRDGTIVQTDMTELAEAPRKESNIQWTGFEHPYLLVAFAPKPQLGQQIEKHTSLDPHDPNLMRTDMLVASTTFKHDTGPVTQDVVAYLGPKNYDDLAKADGEAGFPTGFKSTIDLGWFGFIGHPLLWLLKQFFSVVGNWGISIILLTFLVKAATLYWTTKSMRSMKAMAAISPQMKALQAKYKDDKQRLQAETMALYKTHNVNPIAGCLPILLQMPIWLALYRMLSNAGELYQQPFIPGWINDLTATDPYHVLPFILVATMFIQARLQPAAGDSTQQKMMQYGMPLMFGVMSFMFPSGLTLYIFTNTVLSAFHSIYMNKFDKQSLAIAAKIKLNAELAKSEAEKAAATKSGAFAPANGARKNGKPKAAAKPVIDVAAVEADELEVDADADAPEVGAESSNPARQRPRRKKRRR